MDSNAKMDGLGTTISGDITVCSRMLLQSRVDTRGDQHRLHRPITLIRVETKSSGDLLSTARAFFLATPRSYERRWS